MRAQFSTVLNQVDQDGESFLITKYDQPVAYIIPFAQLGDRHQFDSKNQNILNATRGLWKNRSLSSIKLARKLRKQAERYE